MNEDDLNEELKTFLISSRENAGLSQNDVAARSEVFGIGKILDQRAVSRIESKPIGTDAIKIAGYLSAVGVQSNKYYELLKELTFKEEDVIMSSTSVKDISEQVDAATEKLRYAKQMLSEFDYDIINSIGVIEKFEQLESYVKSLNRKPVIGCFGLFDAGKSTIINTIINESVLPAKYQPATCVVNMLMHVDDKPSTISGSVALFRKGFKPHMIHSEELVGKFLIEQGGYDILDRLGVHNYDEDIGNDAYIAIVFAKANILKKIWLLDTPGDMNSQDDTEKALGGVELADGIIFVSGHTGFFNNEALGFAANIIRQSPPSDKGHPLDHILFVQSHCHSDLTKDEVRGVGPSVFKRIKVQLDNLIFNSWTEDGFIDEAPDPDLLISRVQPFWRDNDEYRTGTLGRVSDMAKFLTENHSLIVEGSIKRVFENVKSIIDSSVDSLEEKKKDSIERIKEVEDKDARFREQSSKLISEFNSLIDSCSEKKKSDVETMKVYFKYNTSQVGLEELIEDTYEDKKEAQSGIGSYISQLLTSKLESTLKTSGRLISGEIESLLARWQSATPSINQANIDIDISDLNLDVNAFNSRAAFVGGFAGLGSLGAMALYVSTIASNLGGYILVGKAAGVLVSLGLVGSVTTVTSFVAAIGGPITIGIALAAAIGYLIFRLAGGSWQKSLAKKVSEAIRKKNVFKDIEKVINDFWDNTARAIKAGLEELIIQTDDYIAKVKAEAKTEYDVSELDECIDALSSTLDKMK